MAGGGNDVVGDLDVMIKMPAVGWQDVGGGFGECLEKVMVVSRDDIAERGNILRGIDGGEAREGVCQVVDILDGGDCGKRVRGGSTANQFKS